MVRKFNFKRKTASQLADSDTFPVESIIGFRSERGVDQYLVWWKGFPKSKATWEPLSHLTGFEEEIQEYHKSVGKKRLKTESEASPADDADGTQEPVDVDSASASQERSERSAIWKVFERLSPLMVRCKVPSAADVSCGCTFRYRSGGPTTNSDRQQG